MIFLLKKVNRLLRRIAFVLLNAGGAWKMTFDPALSRTCYPGERRKSRPRILAENLWWMMRHGEVNAFYYLYGFDLKPPRDQSAYMPNRRFKIIRNRLNGERGIGRYNSDYRCLLKDKFLFDRFASSLGVPTPGICALVRDGKVLWLDGEGPASIDDLGRIEDLDVFCKSLLGECADGVVPLRQEGGVLVSDGREISPDGVSRLLGDSFIIQRRVAQHPEMARLYPHSLNTQRIVTVRSRGRIEVLAILQKLGAGGNTRDNWAIGGITGRIDPETGRFTGKFQYKPGYGGLVTHHPDTGVELEGFRVPFFEETLAAVVGMHRFLYGIHSIGWDTAQTPEGPVIVEGNDNWELTVHQGLEGGLRDEFLALCR